MTILKRGSEYFHRLSGVGAPPQSLGSNFDILSEWHQSPTERGNLKLGEAELAKAHRLRIDDAERAYRRLTKQLPRLPDAQFFLGTLLARTGRCEEAIAPLQQAETLAPNIPAMVVNLAAALRGAGRIREAVKLLADIVAAHSTLFKAWTNLGIAQRESGEREVGIGIYEKAIALRPNSAEARRNLASALQEGGRWDESAARSQEALEIAPNLTQAKRGLGLYHLMVSAPSPLHGISACRAAERRISMSVAQSAFVIRPTPGTGPRTSHLGRNRRGNGWIAHSPPKPATCRVLAPSGPETRR